jgi:hypothetical protein
MGASLAAPDRGIVHARQVVEDQGGRMRKLHARGRRQHELQSIVAEDSAGGDGDERAPTMSATKHRVAGGAGHFRVGLPGKDLREEILDRAPHFSLGGIEVLTGYR